MSTRQFTLLQFIDDLLLPDLQEMIDHELHYYAFSIICQGIELLGAAKDQQPLEKFEESENRFTWALKELFSDVRYRNNQTKFFTYLRGPLIHQLRPGEGFFIASAKKDKVDPKTHLTRHETGALVLIVEPFLGDFRAAVEKFKKRVTAANAVAPERFTRNFITVPMTSLLNLVRDAGFRQTWFTSAEPHLSK